MGTCATTQQRSQPWEVTACSHVLDMFICECKPRIVIAPPCVPLRSFTLLGMDASRFTVVIKHAAACTNVHRSLAPDVRTPLAPCRRGLSLRAPAGTRRGARPPDPVREQWWGPTGSSASTTVTRATRTLMCFGSRTMCRRDTCARYPFPGDKAQSPGTFISNEMVHG